MRLRKSAKTGRLETARTVRLEIVKTALSGAEMIGHRRRGQAADLGVSDAVMMRPVVSVKRDLRGIGTRGHSEVEKTDHREIGKTDRSVAKNGLNAHQMV